MLVNAARVLRAVEEPTDAELLARFADRRDEAAFALLVRRHGPMVYGVCRRVLPEPDAEDAFQSVFLILARKARSAPREVASWLYGVARRAALQSRRNITRRRETVGVMPDCPAPEPSPLSTLLAALDDELGHLPDIYRTVIVLCDLEGRTRREAAASLGWPEGTVAGRLVRARKMLAKRLARHAPAVSVAAILAGSASARVPAVLAPSATIPPGVAALTREVLGVMAGGKLMKTATVLVLVACAGFGVILKAGQVAPAAPTETPVPAPVRPRAGDGIAWGKEVGGLQAGLGLNGGKMSLRHGETAGVVLRVRNVGKVPVEFRHIWAFFVENPPTVTTPDGRTVRFPRVAAEGEQAPRRTTIAPGKDVELYEWKVELRPGKWLGNDGVPAVYGTGKFGFQCERVVGPTSGNPNHPNLALDELATGKLELEVKSAPPEKQKALTPDEAIKVAGDSRLEREFNAKQPPVEFRVEFVTKAILVKAAPKEGGAEWDKGHGPGEVALRAKNPADRKQARFLAILTADVIGQLNKVGVRDVEKHFRGRTVRVRGVISRIHYSGFGTAPEVEILVDDISRLEVIDPVPDAPMPATKE